MVARLSLSRSCFPACLHRPYLLLLVFLLVLVAPPGCDEEDDDAADDDVADDDTVDDDVGDDDSGDDDTAGDDDTGDDDTGMDPNEVVIDPPAGATEVDPTVPTDFSDAIEFLYDGSNAVQEWVAPGTIEVHRVAVLRGRISEADGTPLEGVTCTVLHHPEYGWTYTRADGGYDLAVNGGERLTVRYELTGYLPSLRQIEVPWRDYVWLPDVALVPRDPQVTVIEVAAPPVPQVARGSVVSDADVARQATVVFPADIEAELVFAYGGTAPLTEISFRATEYTVGDAGPASMPSDLPPSTAYTYAVELGVDREVPGTDT